jgi:putative transposase
MQNGFVESFNGRMRDEFLNETLFHNIAHARDLIAAWTTDYNTQRPHSALGYQTPAGFALHLTTASAHPAAQLETSARRAIAQPAPIGVNEHRAPVVAGGKFGGRSAYSGQDVDRQWRHPPASFAISLQFRLLRFKTRIHCLLYGQARWLLLGLGAGFNGIGTGAQLLPRLSCQLASFSNGYVRPATETHLPTFARNYKPQHPFALGAFSLD